MARQVQLEQREVKQIVLTVTITFDADKSLSATEQLLNVVRTLKNEGVSIEVLDATTNIDTRWIPKNEE